MPILTLIILVLPPGLRPWPPLDAESAALVREARERPPASIAAIRTLTCKSDQSWLGRVPDPADPNDVPADLYGFDYWLDGDTFRIRLRVGPHKSDIVQRGDRELELFTDESAPRAVIRRSKRLPWHFPDREARLLAPLLDRPHEIWAARRVTEDGVASVYLDVASPRERVRLWLDPSHGYLVWKAVSGVDVKSPDVERVTEFRRSADGAFLPVRIESGFTPKGVAPLTLVTTLTDVRINKPVPPESFRIPRLAGVRCDDFIRNEENRLDENGESVGPWRTNPKSDDDEPGVNAGHTARYILSGLVAAVLTVAAVSYWRRKRQ